MRIVKPCAVLQVERRSFFPSHRYRAVIGNCFTERRAGKYFAVIRLFSPVPLPYKNQPPPILPKHNWWLIRLSRELDLLLPNIKDGKRYDGTVIEFDATIRHVTIDRYIESKGYMFGNVRNVALGNFCVIAHRKIRNNRKPRKRKTRKGKKNKAK